MFGRRKTPKTVAESEPTRTYGLDGTIHRNTGVNVELDKDGRVVAVWYRCQMIPFTQTVVDKNRADSMNRIYDNEILPEVVSIELLE